MKKEILSFAGTDFRGANFHRCDFYASQDSMEMKVIIKIFFAENSYPFDVDWKLPFFPSVGHVLKLVDILSENQLEESKSIEFKGTGKYEGLNITLYQVISEALDCKVISILWMEEGVELMIQNDSYSQSPENWGIK